MGVGMMNSLMENGSLAKGINWHELRPVLKKAERWHVETY
jgi:ferredoxin--NADP+ reductase